MNDDDILSFEVEGQTRQVSVFDLVDKNSPRASKDLRSKRMEVCKSCDRYSMGVCLECGCVMKLKTILLNSTCPLHKWSFENIEEV